MLHSAARQHQISCRLPAGWLGVKQLRHFLGEPGLLPASCSACFPAEVFCRTRPLCSHQPVCPDMPDAENLGYIAGFKPLVHKGRMVQAFAEITKFAHLHGERLHAEIAVAELEPSLCNAERASQVLVQAGEQPHWNIGHNIDMVAFLISALPGPHCVEIDTRMPSQPPINSVEEPCCHGAKATVAKARNMRPEEGYRDGESVAVPFMVSATPAAAPNARKAALYPK
jgi:hypothetical protein